jgi:hypothetical protein
MRQVAEREAALGAELTAARVRVLWCHVSWAAGRWCLVCARGCG